MTTEQDDAFFINIPKEELTQELKTKLRKTSGYALYQVGIEFNNLWKAIESVPKDVLKAIKSHEQSCRNHRG